jgi:hypothetical protein
VTAAQQAVYFVVQVALRSIAFSKLGYALRAEDYFDPQTPRDWRWIHLRKSDYYPLK